MSESFTLYSQAKAGEELLVEWQEKYGGMKTEKAILVFESTSVYRLIHPHYDKLDVIKANTNEFKVTHQPKEQNEESK